MCSTSEILLQTLYQGQHHAMPGFVLYYGFQHCGFLWISSVLVHSLIEVLLIIPPSQLTLYYSGWISLLKFCRHSLMSRHQISMAPSGDVYIRQKYGDASVLK